MSRCTIKENVQSGSLSVWWVCAALGVSLLLCLAAMLADNELPEPLTKFDDPEQFIGELAHEFLVNLTSIGPRVAGSYENEVSAVSLLTSALRRLAAEASPHNALDVEVHTASGAFSLTFFDGMNMLYRDVRSVVARARARGAGPSPAAGPRGLLLNCHFDTVPDSPGASDDGAGCAVVVGVVRALLTSRRPLQRPLVLLLNGAEENIMQGSHAALTGHRWLAGCGVFINLEACGAGGREVVFQWGPGAGLLRLYAARAPRPFGGSLAQDLFSAGAVPADTDFRVFRDIGNMSGLDLAWSRSGYVYHTHLDTVERVSAAVLQRTGDNVLALARGVMEEGWEESPREPAPVFFDVWGRRTVLVGAPGALGAAGAALAGALLLVETAARQAHAQLSIPRRWWYRCVWSCAWCSVRAAGAGVSGAALSGLVLRLLGAGLPYYGRPGLLLPLYCAPALAGGGLAATWLWGRQRGVATMLRGPWLARAFTDAVVVLWTLLMMLGTMFGIRSSVVAWWWCALPSLGALLGTALGGALLGALGGALLGALLAAAQAHYLAHSVLGALVPLWGRAPPMLAPPDVVMGAVMAAITLANCCWMLPIYMITKNTRRLSYGVLIFSLLFALLVALTPLGAPYSASTPQRIMLFHTRTTVHNASLADGAAVPTSEFHYWVPELDVNTRDSMLKYAGALNSSVLAPPCLRPRLLHCGAPYHLPVTSLVPRAVWLPGPPHSHTLALASHRAALNETTTLITLHITGPQHVVVVVAPRRESNLVLVESGSLSLVPLRDKHHHKYFISLHAKRGANQWTVHLYLQHLSPAGAGRHWAQLSVGGHWMCGVTSLGGMTSLAGVTSLGGAAARRLPGWMAVTGWPAHTHHLLL